MWRVDGNIQKAQSREHVDIPHFGNTACCLTDRK